MAWPGVPGGRDGDGDLEAMGDGDLEGDGDGDDSPNLLFPGGGTTPSTRQSLFRSHFCKNDLTLIRY